jgi:PadR family transcriptional regulator, regulatory protein PadR
LVERLTGTKKKAIAVLYEAAPEALYGLEISRLASIASGSLYPALRDLRRAGLVETEWRAPDDDPDGQPLRYYRLSPNGFALAQELAADNVAGTSWRRYLSASPRIGLLS